jgi:hypothetical protein
VDKRNLVTDISGLLKPLGFHRRGSNWYRSLNEVVQVANLQRSKWGPQFYVNVGILIRQIEDIASPRHSQCHLIGRLEMFVSESRREYCVVDLDSSTAEKRWESILQTFRNEVVPFFTTCVDESGIRRFLRQGKTILITGEARAFLRAR